jgi:glycosyltransferase involved in cell wall biosynthesis
MKTRLTQDIFLIIPCFNENRRIKPIINSALKYFPAGQIVLIDDGSLHQIKLNTKAVILRHVLNLGKGAALKTGIEYAKSKGASKVILMDGDGQHKPEDLPRFIEKLAEYDVVFGSRRPGLDVPLIRFLGNKFATIYINILFGIYIADILSGFRGFSLDAYPLINWQSLRYGVETEMVARLGKVKDKLSFCEIPIETVYIDKYKGVTILDALHILSESIWWKLF